MNLPSAAPVTIEFIDDDTGFESVLSVRASRPNSEPIKNAVTGARYKKGSWQFPPDHDILIQLVTMYGERLDAHPHIVNWHHGWQERKADRLELLNVETSPFSWLRPYQYGASLWMQDDRTGIVSAGVGTGKTRIALHTAFNSGNELLPSLVIAPASVLTQWKVEAESLFPEASVAVVAGSAQKRRKILAEDHDLYIMSYGTVPSHAKVEHFGSAKRTKKDTEDKELNWMMFDCVIVDEAHRLCNPTNKSTRAIWSLSKVSDRRYGLTATPIRNKSLELWSIMRWLKPDVWTSRSKFKEFYCDHGEDFAGYEWVKGIREDRMEAFEKSIGYHILTIEPDDVIDELPDEMTHFRVVQLPPKQRKIYDTLRTKEILELGDEKIPVPEPAVRNTRLLQLAQGPLIKSDDHYAIDAQASHKADELIDLLEALDGEQVVIFAHHVDVIRDSFLIAKNIGPAGMIDGSVVREARDSMVEQFQAGDLQYLVCSIACMGEGVTLTAASHVIYMEGTYSAVDDKQTRGRVRRIGQEASTVHYFYIITEDTVDEDQLESIGQKAHFIAQVRGTTGE